MKKLFRLFCPKWQVKEVYKRDWFIKDYDEMGDAYEYKDWTLFEIMYSEPRNEWKLKMSGRTPKLHPSYPSVVERLNQIRSEY